MKKETKKITIRLVLVWIRWIFSVLFILEGFRRLISFTISGILMILAGVILLPLFGRFLKEKANMEISGWLEALIVLILLVIANWLIYIKY